MRKIKGFPILISKLVPKNTVMMVDLRCIDPCDILFGDIKSIENDFIRAAKDGKVVICRDVMEDN